MLELIIISALIIGIAIIGIAIKMFLIKGGRFTKSCESIDAQGKRTPCTCNKLPEEPCENSNKTKE